MISNSINKCVPQDIRASVDLFFNFDNHEIPEGIGTQYET